MITVFDFVQSAEKLVSENKYELALHRIYSAKARCWKGGQFEDLKERISKLQDKSISAIRANLKPSSSFAPFYQWEKERQGAGTVFIAGISNNQSLSEVALKSPAFLSSLEMATKLSCGDWAGAAEINDAKPADINRIMAMARGGASLWLPSIAFSRSFYGNRFAISSDTQSGSSALLDNLYRRFQKSSPSPRVSIITAFLAAEDALSLGNFVRASDIISSYEFKSEPKYMIDEAGLALLAIYAAINGRENFDEIKEMADALKQYSGAEELSEDIFWVKSALSLLAGPKNFSDEELKRMSESNPFYGDICSRIMLSALSLSALSERHCPDSAKIAEIISSKTWGLTAQSQTFRNLSYFRLAVNSNNIHSFRRESERILAEPRIPAIPSYPALSMFALASASQSGLIGRGDVPEILVRRFEDSPCASFSDSEVARKAMDGDYQEKIAAICSKGMIENAFNAAIFFLLCSDKAGEDALAMVRTLNENESFLNAEQKYLLKNVWLMISEK
jgi:hypothetical protein